MKWNHWISNASNPTPMRTWMCCFWTATIDPLKRNNGKNNYAVESSRCAQLRERYRVARNYSCYEMTTAEHSQPRRKISNGSLTACEVIDVKYFVLQFYWSLMQRWCTDGAKKRSKIERSSFGSRRTLPFSKRQATELWIINFRMLN